MLIKTLVPKLAIQAFDKGILRWFAGLNKAKCDTCFLAPEEHSFASELGSIVTDHLLGLASHLTQLIEKSSHLTTTD